MNHHFTFIIRDKKFEGYKKIASLLFVINAVLFITWALDHPFVLNKIILFTAAFILLAYAAYNWVNKKKKERSYIIIYLLIAGIWISVRNYQYLAVIFIVLAMLQSRMENDVVISLSPEDVTITGLTSQHHPWNAFNNIILKDGLLTLDFINNRILQAEPDWTESAARDMEINDTLETDAWKTGEDYPQLEKEFNEFCRQQLKK